VIPAVATLELSVRALDRDVRACSSGASRRWRGAGRELRRAGPHRLAPGYAVLVNTAAETDFAREVAWNWWVPTRW
jgi:hippurate hydrolase